MQNNKNNISSKTIFFASLRGITMRLPKGRTTKQAISLIHFFIIGTLLFVIFSSCQKLSLKPILKIKSDSVYVNNNVVYAVSTVIDFEDSENAKAGHCWSKYHNPTISHNHVISSTGVIKGTFTDMLTALEPLTHYYIRSFITDERTGEIIYGDEMEITTSGISLSVVNGSYVIVNKNTVTMAGIINHVGSFSYSGFGHCWSQNNLPAISDDKTYFSPLTNDTTWFSNVAALTPGKNYYIRAYARLNETDIVYSDEVVIYIPELKVTTDTYIITGINTATVYGSIAELGIDTVVEHGFCWSYTTSQPDINDNKVSLGNVTQTGSFNYGMTNLTQSIKYYFRAYAVEGTNIRYGSIKNFILN